MEVCTYVELCLYTCEESTYLSGFAYVHMHVSIGMAL